MKVNIYRSKEHRVIAGVIGGLSEYYNWNLTVARLIFLLLALTPLFPGIIVYLVLWLLMKKPA
ncbi:PspC domain-containing protein [Lentilactobacillus parafarraginis]|nr:PspC domain-containing protein [Lentilactobacillus parafarraginis]TLQ20970.1 PspC domain-containing protein [Lentilactobacillus parafarraginis]